MSQQQKLEKVLDLLLSEDQDQAAELLHQIIVEKARNIYENIVDEEDDAEDKEELDEADVVGGDPNEDFTNDIASDRDEVEADELNDGEAGADDEAEAEEDDAEEDETEERLEDLESQLAELRAEFDALMGEEMQEPNHAELAADMADGELDGEMDMAAGAMAQPVTEVPSMYEKKKVGKLDKAPQAKLAKKDKKVDEETQFLQKVADTGQKGTAKLVGTGKGMTLGAEQNKSSFTNIPPRKDYGGKPTKFGSGTGGEYGKYTGEAAKDETVTDNVDVAPKSSSIKADATPKFTGGKSAGPGFTKSPLTKKPA
jgi:hypothetical protein